jgi:hypothetical protein
VEDTPIAESGPAPVGLPDGIPDVVAGRRLKGIEAAKVHGTLLAVLTLCTLAFRFEFARALGGNGLSWAYVFEWPLFAAFGIYMWWTVLHGGRGSRRKQQNSATRPAPKPLDPKYAGMLDACRSR